MGGPTWGDLRCGFYLDFEPEYCGIVGLTLLSLTIAGWILRKMTSSSTPSTVPAK